MSQKQHEKTKNEISESFRLIDSNWNKVLTDAIRCGDSSVRFICPFIKRGVVERLLNNGKPKTLQVITRFHLGEFSEGVSDLSALRLLLERGAMIRGVRNLHAKLYLFGEEKVIVTSANLTDAALRRNHEFGFIAEDAGIVSRCREYFDDLWKRAGENLTEKRLAAWEKKIEDHLASGARQAATPGLGDEGVSANLPPEPIVLPVSVSDAPQAFVKFFGEGHNRAERSWDVSQEVKGSGCHWACTYPKGKRPRNVQDGALIFMGRLVKEPNDILIYGRAVGLRHVPGRDDATEDDIKLRTWKQKWPHYIRVHHAEFIAGSLVNGVSLHELMASLQSDAFAPTQRHAAKGKGNTDPRKAFMQQAAVELTPQSTIWLSEQFQRALEQHGRLSAAFLEKLDWPKENKHVNKTNK